MPGGIRLIKCWRIARVTQLVSQLSGLVLCCAQLLRKISRLGFALLLIGTCTTQAAVEYIELDTYSVEGLQQALLGASAEDQARIYTKLSRHELERNVQQSREYLRAAERLVDPDNMATRAYIAANWCWLHIHTSGLAVARNYCEQSVELAEQSSSDWVRVKGYSAMAAWHYQSGELRLAYEAARQSLEHSLLTGDVLLIGNCYNTLGLIVRAQGSYRKSLDSFKSSLELLDRRIHTELYRIVSFNIGLSYADLGNFELAKEFYVPAMEWMRENQRHAKEFTAMIYIGIADVALGQPQQVIDTLEAALTREELLSNSGYLGFAYAVIGEAYLALGQITEALSAYSTGMEYARQVPNTFEHRRLSTGYARVLVEVGEYDQARSLLNASIDQLRSENSRQMLLDSLSLLSDLEERVGNYRESLLANQEARELEISFQRQSLEHDLAMLRTDFELEEKEAELAQAERDGVIRNGLLAAVVAIALMLYLIVSRRMQVLKAEEGAQHAAELEAVVAERTEELEQKIVQANRAEQGRLALERQLGEAEKLRVLGQLTGGIAHDFNNLLTVVIGSTELLRNKDSVDASVKALADNVLTAANAGADITKALMAYARRQPLQLETVKLAEFIQAREFLLRRTLGDRITLSIEVDADDELEVVLDSSQLTTALLNLALNARDAQDRNGVVDIRLSQRSQRWAVICVSDQGKGMTKEQTTRAIEPFYTTKDELQGNGLGLSMVYGFSKQLGGDLEIESQVGVGTDIRIVLPLADAATGTSNASLNVVKG